jgi:Ser-tRNA(Ala) deacylase AlaX
MPLPTHLVYLEDFNILELQSTVLEEITDEKGLAIILDSTVFYAQGGGQPFDIGTIENSDVEEPM